MSRLSFQERVDKLDWNCASADTQYLTHGIHRYSGKFIPQIARQAIELLSQQGDLVLDPYCGSGTTVLEAAVAGRKAIGLDLNPLAVLISSVKSTDIAYENLNEFIFKFEGRIKSLFDAQPELSHAAVTGEDVDERITRDDRWSSDWHAKWYQRHALRELIGIHQEIAALEPGSCKNLALLAFSDILRRTSNAHNGYPNVMFDRNHGRAAHPAPLFIQRLRQVGESVSKLEGAVAERPSIIRGDATKLALDDGVVDAVVTHPPYIGSVPYAEYGALSLVWLGHNPKSLDESLTGGKRQKRDVIERFERDYKLMIEESARVLKRRGSLFVLVGTPTVRGKLVDMAAMTKRFCADFRLEQVAEAYRSGVNRRANLMGHETLLFFRKK